jgi:hypothetical protein
MFCAYYVMGSVATLVRHGTQKQLKRIDKVKGKAHDKIGRIRTHNAAL